MSRQPLIIQVIVGGGIACAALFAYWRTSLFPFSSTSGPDIAAELANATALTERTEWDFGEIRSGGVAEAAFEIRNAGRRRLILRKANGDCDCVSTGEPEIVVEPGGCRTVVARLDTKKVAGPVKIGVHYQTNDPRRPRLSLFCLANVMAE